MMDYRQVLIGDELHRRVKATAALCRQSIREFVEDALNKHLLQVIAQRVVAGYLAGLITAEEAMRELSTRIDGSPIGDVVAGYLAGLITAEEAMRELSTRIDGFPIGVEELKVRFPSAPVGPGNGQ